MKKLLFAAALVAVFAFSSCKKCKDCTYIVLGTTTVATEYCGDELDRAEAVGFDCK